MLNYIWAGMILLGVIYGVCTGQMSALTEGALDSAGEAVSLCITMAGVMALWMGLMEIAQESGMITKMTKGIRPFLKFMFPRLPEDHPAGEYIATNLIANVLGLGVYTGGTESHGAAGGTGERTARNECVSCQQRNVYLFDPEYFVLTTDPGQHDRLSQPIRQCQPRGDHCSGTGGYTFQHHHFRDLL